MAFLRSRQCIHAESVLQAESPINSQLNGISPDPSISLQPVGRLSLLPMQHYTPVLEESLGGFDGCVGAVLASRLNTADGDIG